MSPAGIDDNAAAVVLSKTGRLERDNNWNKFTGRG